MMDKADNQAKKLMDVLVHCLYSKGHPWQPLTLLGSRCCEYWCHTQYGNELLDFLDGVG